MFTIGLVPCGAAKREHPCPARDMYISYGSRTFVEYIDIFCDDWLMVTSKYGPCFPDQIIAPYDDYLGHHSQAYQKEWFNRYFPEPFMSMLYRDERQGQEIQVLSLLTMPFRRFLHPALEKMGINVISPISHLTIYKGWQEIRKAINAKRMEHANLRPLFRRH